MGGGGARSRSRIAGSGGRVVDLPAATGRVADGAARKDNSGSWMANNTYSGETAFWQDELWTDFEKSNSIRYKKVSGIPQVGYK